MKTRSNKGRIQAFNSLELLVVLVAMAVLAAMLLPALSAAKRKNARINCVNNLHEITTAFRVWEGDNGDKYPMTMILTNNETMRLVGNGNAYLLWQTMSNELGTPKVLHCPADIKRVQATSFATGFGDANISYFLNPDASENFPNMIMDGDRNLTLDGVPVKPGIVTVSSTNSLGWTDEIHGRVSNISMADGSVQQMTTAGLNAAAVNATNGTDVTTFRLVVP